MTLIGIVPSWVEEKKITINQDYVEAVLRAGGTPVLFPVTDDREQLSALLDRVDGLLLTGGPDVDPAEYGEKRKPCCARQPKVTTIFHPQQVSTGQYGLPPVCT